MTTKPTVLDFTSAGCVPCRQLGHLIHVLAGRHPDVDFIPVDIEANEEITLKLGINAVPTLLWFGADEDQPRHVTQGLLTLEQMEQLVASIKEPKTEQIAIAG